MTGIAPAPTFHFDSKPHVLIVQAATPLAIAEPMLAGAFAELEAAGATYDILPVPGLLDLPAAILYAVKALDFDAARRRYDGYIALGCCLQGAPGGYVLGLEAIRALQQVALQYTLAIGHGVLLAADEQQAKLAIDPTQGNHGGKAALNVLRMIEIKQAYRLTPKRRWVAKT